MGLLQKYEKNESDQLKYMLEDSQDLFVVEKTICEEKPFSPSPVHSQNLYSQDFQEEDFLKDDSEERKNKVRDVWNNKFDGSITQPISDPFSDPIPHPILDPSPKPIKNTPVKQDQPAKSILNKFKNKQVENSSSVQIIESIELIADNTKTEPNQLKIEPNRLKIESVIELESGTKENLNPEKKNSSLVLIVKPENTPSPAVPKRRLTRNEMNKRVQEYKNMNKQKPLATVFKSPDSIHTHRTDKSKKDVFRKVRDMKVKKNEISPSCETAELPISTNSSPKMSSPKVKNEKSYRNM